MKIAVASIFDPWNAQSWSGCSHNLLRALIDDYGVKVIALGPIKTPRPLRNRIVAEVRLKLGRNYIPEFTGPSLRHYAAHTSKKLKEINCDCVLALDGHTIAYLETELPVYYFWDCTFEGNLEYPWFTKLAARSLAAGHAIERDAVRNARMSFYSSKWAVASAIRTYGADPSRTKIVPLAANIKCERTQVDLERLISERSTDIVQLLFLGVDWLRKGGDLALAVARELNSRGTRAVLHVAGCAPGPAIDIPEFVRLHGFLNKAVPAESAELQSLVGNAHFLIVPSLAESFGAVFAEASSFGTPSLARRVGGVDSVVKEGVNGFLFDRDADPKAYCDTIESIWKDPERYRDLARSSFRHFQERLTWTHSAGKLLEYIREDLRRGA